MGLGVDIIEIARIERAIASERFLTRVYTSDELEYLTGKRPESYAGVFAAKEACIKAGGGGHLHDVAIHHDASGAPHAVAGGRKFSLSISHCREYAVAVAVQI